MEFPFRHVDFVLDPAKPKYAYVLTEDGTLHRLDILSLERISQASVTAPYSMDGQWRDPRPRLAVVGDEIVLTDPNAGLVRVIDAESLEELRASRSRARPTTSSPSAAARWFTDARKGPAHAPPGQA